MIKFLKCKNPLKYCLIDGSASIYKVYKFFTYALHAFIGLRRTRTRMIEVQKNSDDTFFNNPI